MKVKKTEKNNFIGWFGLGLVGWFGYAERQKFLKFINNLKLSLKVLKLENGAANILVENITHNNIPYCFEDVKLINATKVLAINVQPKIGGLIAHNASNPILFNTVKETTIAEIEASNIAITYNFYGFKFKRLYRIEKAIIVDQLDNSKEPKTQNICGCGC